MNLSLFQHLFYLNLRIVPVSLRTCNHRYSRSRRCILYLDVSRYFFNFSKSFIVRPFAPPGVSNMIPQRPGFAPAPNFVTSSSMPPPNIPVLNTAGGMFYPGAPPPNIMHPGMQSVTMPNPNLSFSNIPPGMHPAMQNQSYAPPSVIHHRPSNNQFNSPSNPPINPHLSNPRYPNPHHHSQIHHQNPRQTNAQTQSSSHASRQNQAMRPPANYSNKSQIQPRNPRS